MATDVYSGWGWILWFGMIFLLFSSMGNWGYTYQAHRRYIVPLPNKDALDILAERYAKSELSESQFMKMREDILSLMSSKTRSARLHEPLTT